MESSHKIFTLSLRGDAPEKPPPGAACNGCGVCCAVNTCPAARLRFLRRRGPCPALLWSAERQRYLCGFLVEPARFFPVPSRLLAVLRRLGYRWIAAGSGCDCSVEVLPDEGES